MRSGAPIPNATDPLGGIYILAEEPGDSIAVTPGVSYSTGDWCLCINEAEGWVHIDAANGGGGGGGGVLRLTELVDVDCPSPNDGDLLAFDAFSNTWKNVSEISGGTF